MTDTTTPNPEFFEQKLETLTAKLDDLRANRDATSAERRAEAQQLAEELDAVKNVLVNQLAELRDALDALE